MYRDSVISVIQCVKFLFIYIVRKCCKNKEKLLQNELYEKGVVDNPRGYAVQLCQFKRYQNKRKHVVR